MNATASESERIFTMFFSLSRFPEAPRLSSRTSVTGYQDSFIVCSLVDDLNVITFIVCFGTFRKQGGFYLSILPGSSGVYVCVS